MPGTASYQMYDWPQSKAAARRFWRLIRFAYGSGDPELTEFTDPELAWSDPDLLFSQTCGLPYRHRLHQRVNLLGTLDYGLPGCPPGHYRSCVIVRRADPRESLLAFEGARLARNSMHSQSGWAALESHLAAIGARFRLRDDVVETGSHAKSLHAVAEGRADIASLDAVTFGFLTRYDPATDKVRILTRTRTTPGLPLITGRSVDPEPLFRAVAAAIGQLTDDERHTLCIKGVQKIPQSAYLAEPLPYPLSAND